MRPSQKIAGVENARSHYENWAHIETRQKFDSPAGDAPQPERASTYKLRKKTSDYLDCYVAASTKGTSPKDTYGTHL